MGVVEHPSYNRGVDLLGAVAFATSAAALYGGAWRATARTLRGSWEDQWLGTMVLGTFAAIVMLRVLGALALLSALPLTLAGIAVGSALWAVGRGHSSAPRPVRIGRMGRIALAMLGLLLSGLLVQAWLYRSTAWDSLWYHVVVTHAYVAQGSTRWLDVGVDQASGYPEAVELLAAWPCAILRSTTFDDTPQIPFGLMGAALVAAWSRRAGASQGVALAFAAIWMAMPPVILQLTANLNDVALATCVGATLYFLTAAPESPQRSHWTLICATMALAVKGSALVLLAPLAPFLVLDQLGGARARGALVGTLDLLVRTCVLVGVGLMKPIENYLHTGNPVWPFRRTFLGHSFEGPFDPTSITWNGMHGLDAFFFSGEGDALRMITSWYDPTPGYEPNVGSGGFGPVHAYFGVPAIVVALVIAVRGGARLGERGGRRRALVAALLLFALGIQGSNPWWPRFILAASVASAVVCAAVIARSKFRSGLTYLALAISLGAAVHATSTGIESYREHGFFAVLERSPEERAALALGPLWPEEVILERDATLGPRDALAYESSIWLAGQFYPRRYRSRLVWVEPDGTGEAYLARLRAAGARWVVLRSTRYRRELVRLGAVEQWVHGDEAIVVLPPE